MHAHTPELPPAQYWQARYAEATVWSGKVNATTADVAGGLPVPPGGRALDLGCGEGGDAVWLAERGWAVTGVDIAPAAIERARAHAAAVGVPVDFVVGDLEDVLGELEPGFGLVTASFLHSPVPLARIGVLRRAAELVALGGHLLLVTHEKAPAGLADAMAAAGHRHDELLTPEQEVVALDLAGFTPVLVESRRREGVREGKPMTFDDGVILLRREP